MFYPRQPATFIPQVVGEQASWVPSCIAESQGMARMMAFNLEVDVNSAATRRQVHGHAAVHRVFSASRTTENQRGFPSGGVNSAYEQTAPRKNTSQSFLEIRMRETIRQIYAQLHRSHSPSNRRAVWMACDSGLVFLPPTRAWSLGRGPARGTERNEVQIIMLL
jgi:hypothetical protein